jgi:hypothetical protein
MEDLVDEFRSSTQVESKYVGPKLKPRKRDFTSYRHYFPNQSTSNQVQPVFEFSAAYGRYPGISSDPGQKSFTGSSSANAILTPVINVLENGLPVTKNTLENVKSVVDEAKEIGRMRQYQISFEPILIYLLTYYDDMQSPMIPAIEKLKEGVRLLYPSILHDLIIESCIAMLSKVASKNGEHFQVNSIIALHDRERFVELLKSLYFSQRLPFEALVNKKKQQMIAVLSAKAVSGTSKDQIDNIDSAREIRDRNEFKRKVINSFRANQMNYEHNSAVMNARWNQRKLELQKELTAKMLSSSDSREKLAIQQSIASLENAQMDSMQMVAEETARKSDNPIAAAQVLKDMGISVDMSSVQRLVLPSKPYNQETDIDRPSLGLYESSKVGMYYPEPGRSPLGDYGQLKLPKSSRFKEENYFKEDSSKSGKNFVF